MNAEQELVYRLWSVLVFGAGSSKLSELYERFPDPAHLYMALGQDGAERAMLTPQRLAAVDSTTGEMISKEVAEELYTYLKAKVVSEGLTDPEKIKTLLEEAENQYNVTLTDEQKQKLSELMPAIGGIELDPGTLLSQAGDLYDKYGDTVLSNAKELYTEVVTDEVKQSFGDAFKTLIISILDTIKNKVQNH